MTLVAPSIAPPAVGGLIAIDNASWELYEIAASAALPFMTPAIVDRFIGLMLAGENTGLRAFQSWLRSLPEVLTDKKI